MKLNVRQLIERLEMYPDDKPVIIASDEEGNSFGTVDDSEIWGDEKAVVIYPYKSATDIEELI